MTHRDVDNLLPRLERWYRGQCDGEWEHGSGIRIGTLDNPGWSLEVNLRGTELAGRAFPVIKRGLDGPKRSAEWMTCYVEGEVFKGFGGPEMLKEMVAVFLNWAEAR